MSRGLEGRGDRGWDVIALEECVYYVDCDRELSDIELVVTIKVREAPYLSELVIGEAGLSEELSSLSAVEESVVVVVGLCKEPCVLRALLVRYHIRVKLSISCCC